MIGTRNPAGNGRHAGVALIAGLATASLCLTLLATPASAIVTYSGPLTLSGAGGYGGGAQIALDESGRATIVWARYDGSTDRIQAVRLDADGTPGPVQTLSPLDDAYDPAVAVDGSGRATIAWAGRAPGDFFTRIQSVRLDADGTPGPVQTHSQAGRDAFVPQVAIDSSDRATITWWRESGSNTRIQSVRLAADGGSEEVQTLSEVGKDADFPQIAIDSFDRATITWEAGLFPDSRIQSVRVAADGTPGEIQTLSAAGRRAAEPQIAIDASDRPTITWSRYDGTNARIQAVRIAADGTPGLVQTLSEAGHEAGHPRLAIDGSDRATITWLGFDFTPDGPPNRIEAVRLAADGTPAEVQALSPPGDSAEDAQIAIDDSGRATIVWRTDRIESVRLSAGGAAGPVRTISAAGQAAFHPRLAIDGHGRATIVWARSGGSEVLVQSARAEIHLPETTVTAGPQGTTGDPDPNFAFIADQPGSSFECSLDSDPFASCTSPQPYSNLPDGPHTFAVRATDVEGDLDATPAERSFMVDTVHGSATAARIQVQAGKRIVLLVRVQAAERLTATGGGKVKLGKASYALGPKTKRISSGRTRKLKLRPQRGRHAKKIAEALKKGKRAKAKLRVDLSDVVGGEKTVRLSVKLRR